MQKKRNPDQRQLSDLISVCTDKAWGLFYFLSSINTWGSAVCFGHRDYMSQCTSRNPRGYRACLCFQCTSGQLMLWDQEEVHPSDKQDGSLAYKKYGGTHLDLSIFKLGENCCFMSYILLN